jgi:hypothetical protein
MKYANVQLPITPHKRFVPYGTHPNPYANAQDFFYAGNVRRNGGLEDYI